MTDADKDPLAALCQNIYGTPEYYAHLSRLYGDGGPGQPTEASRTWFREHPARCTTPAR